jgi:hypothetical protein
VIPAAVVLLVPALLLPMGALVAPVPGDDPGRYPVWAVEAFGAEPLDAALAALSMPIPMQMLALLAAVGLPLLGASIGLGSVGRWAALSGFCLVGAVLGGLLTLGLLLELVLPGSADATGLQTLVGLSWPLLAIEGCGCLLAASVAPSARSGSGS